MSRQELWSVAMTDKQISRRLLKAKLGEAGCYEANLMNWYREGMRLAERGVLFFRPSADLSKREVSAMRLGHSDAMAKKESSS